jgi:hypothetical protein
MTGSWRPHQAGRSSLHALRAVSTTKKPGILQVRDAKIAEIFPELRKIG